MRAAKTAAEGVVHLPVGRVFGTRPGAGIARGEAGRSQTAIWQAGGTFGALFFLGYLFGIIKGRLGDSAFGTTLAAYYMDAENFSSVGALFLDLYSGAVLQAILVLVCGFSALGTVMLGGYFCLRGAVMGLCAAGVFVQGGTRALVVHWMLTCLPDLGVFLVMLWLSFQANACASVMFRCAFGSGGHLRQTPPLKPLLLRFLSALALAAVLCLLGAASGVVFAGVLL